MRTTLRVLVVGLIVVASAGPASSHHSFALEYDGNKPVEFEGIVSKIEWTNPHARIYVDVKDATGKVNTWNLELASLSALVRNGWTRTSLKPGDRVKVSGFDGRGVNTYRANATAIVTASGQSLFSGSAGEDGRPSTPAR